MSTNCIQSSGQSRKCQSGVHVLLLSMVCTHRGDSSVINCKIPHGFKVQGTQFKFGKCTLCSVCSVVTHYTHWTHFLAHVILYGIKNLWYITSLELYDLVYHWLCSSQPFSSGEFCLVHAAWKALGTCLRHAWCLTDIDRCFTIAFVKQVPSLLNAGQVHNIK